MSTPKIPEERDRERARLINILIGYAASIDSNDWAQMAILLERTLVEKIREVEASILRLRTFPPRVRKQGEPRSIWLGDVSDYDNKDPVAAKEQLRETYLKWLDVAKAFHDVALHAEAERFADQMAEYFGKGKK